MEYQDKVLILDDEPENIEALVKYLDNCEIGVDYFASLAQGAEALNQTFHNKEPYFAVVCDNHFTYTGLEAYNPNLNGIDFMNILLGKEERMMKGSCAVISDFFGSNYEDIKELYKGKLILFSGSAFNDSQYDSDLFYGLEPVQKIPDSNGVSCECNIISVLSEMGIDCNKKTDSIHNYKTKNHLENGERGSIEEEHEKRVQEFLEDIGYKDDGTFNLY